MILENLLTASSYRFNVHSLPPLFIGLILVAVGWIALVRNRRSLPSVIFSLLLFSGAVWILSYAGLFSSANPEIALQWAKIEHLGVVMIPGLIFLFASVLVGYGRQFAVYFWIVFVLSFFFLWSLFFTPYFIVGVHRYPWGYFPHYGPLCYAFIVFIALLIWANLVLHWLGWRRASLEEPRKMSRRFFIAFSIAQLGMIDFLPGFGIPVYPVGSIAVLMAVGILAETVLRFQLTTITLTFATEHILQALADVLVVFDKNGIIQIVNPATCRLLAREASHLIGASVAQAFEDPVFERASLEDIARQGGITDYETAYQPLPNRCTPFSFTISVIRDSQYRLLGYVLIGRDITARKHAEEEIQKAKGELELRVAARTEELRVANEKLMRMDQVKSDFILMASHELRTPLSALTGYLQLISDEKAGALNERQREFLGYVRSSADRLHRLIKDLLSLSRMQTGQLQLERVQVPLRKLILDQLESFKPLAQKKEMVLSFEEENELGSVPCDHDRIEEVIANLISNAIKYSLRRGKVVIYARRFPKHVEILVSDEGVGIPSGELEKIFEPFYRLHKTGPDGEESTGLGLALVKKIMELHHGEISVESKPAFGSTFKVTLPT